MSPSALPDPYETERAETLATIDAYGYVCNVVGTGECSVPGCNCEPEPYPYAYTVGMIEIEHPELVMFGVALSGVNVLARPVYEAAAAGTPLAIGREHRHDLGNHTWITLLHVPDMWVGRDPGRIGGWLDTYAATVGRVPPFLQVFWSDEDGAMPWDADCDRDVAALQPILADDPLRYPKPPRNTSRHRRTRRR